MSRLNNSVIIKGNKYGIVVVMDKELPFEELKECLREKFSSASKFFDNANMAITFEGRKLSVAEEREILDLIAQESDINIVCVMDNDVQRQEEMHKAVEAKLDELAGVSGHFYKGTLRSGQVLESESSLIILGDVNPGGKVVAKGNIIILGALKGSVYAGAGGNDDAFVVALDMIPMQIRINEVIARCQDNSGKPKKIGKGPQIAFVEDGNIYIENLDKSIISDIRI